MSHDGDEVRRRSVAAGVAWAHQVGNHLAGAAARDAPVREGALRASAHVDVSVDGDGVSVTVSFDEVYAERQHEGVTFKHPKGGKAKYLEDQLKANLTRYQAALAAAARRELS